jgi:hypothetical protein
MKIKKVFKGFRQRDMFRILCPILISLQRSIGAEECVSPTVCFSDLDHGSKMINFESILTTIIVSIVLRGRWGSKNCLKLEIEPPYANLACLKQ